MDHFTVLSDRVPGHEKGDEITARSLAGANIDALVEGGHLKPKRAEASKTSKNADPAPDEKQTGSTPATAEKPEGSE